MLSPIRRGTRPFLLPACRPSAEWICEYGAWQQRGEVKHVNRLALLLHRQYALLNIHAPSSPTHVRKWVHRGLMARQPAATGLAKLAPYLP